MRDRPFLIFLLNVHGAGSTADGNPLLGVPERIATLL